MPRSRHSTTTVSRWWRWRILDSVAVTGAIIIAPGVDLTDGSGFSVDPLACHDAPYHD